MPAALAGLLVFGTGPSGQAQEPMDAGVEAPAPVEPPPTVRADELRHAVFLIGETGRAVLRGPEGADDFAWTDLPETTQALIDALVACADAAVRDPVAAKLRASVALGDSAGAQAMFQVAALYRFASFDDPAALRQPLLDLCAAHGVKGTPLNRTTKPQLLEGRTITSDTVITSDTSVATNAVVTAETGESVLVDPDRVWNVVDPDSSEAIATIDYGDGRTVVGDGPFLALSTAPGDCTPPNTPVS